MERNGVLATMSRLTLTPQQEALIRASFEAFRPMSHETSMLFYGRLFALDPSLRAMFPKDLREQAKKLADTLDVCVQNLERLPELRPQLRALGKRHLDYGARPEHYALVTQALLWSLGQALEQGFDAPTKAAWSALLASVCAEMQQPA